MVLELLIAEDTPEIARAVAYGARMTWPDCRVTIAGSGAEALARFGEERPDLVVLDVQMPPPHGFEVCRRIREVSTVPILMLTVRDATLDKVQALDLGADDYLTKPFDHLELLARLRALVRRSSLRPPAPETAFTAGDLSLHFASHQVHVGDELVRLTPTEYRLLEVLVRRSGAVVPHQVLLDHVWGPDFGADQQYLKVFIRRLRNKLGDDREHPRYIQTARGMGYRLVLPR
ncbi:MAG: response regulator transcription factor [Chloroflexota bacterium]|nr:response regulator transcription factor [Chloroflexota bacterium]